MIIRNEVLGSYLWQWAELGDYYYWKPELCVIVILWDLVTSGDKNPVNQVNEFATHLLRFHI